MRIDRIESRAWLRQEIEKLEVHALLVYRARPSSRSRNFRTRIIKRGREAGERV